MEYFVQQLINGITLGSIYGLIAIGYTMVYGIIGMINFAHGDIFMVGAFLALIAFLVVVAIGVTAVPLALFIVLLVSMALTALCYNWGFFTVLGYAPFPMEQTFPLHTNSRSTANSPPSRPMAADTSTTHTALFSINRVGPCASSCSASTPGSSAIR